MATIPARQTLPKTNASVAVLNAIRESATIDYQNYIPEATADDGSIRKIGAIMMDNPSLQNEFISSLVNRIGIVLVKTATYENPWAFFKKGMLDFGETIEEIFVDLAKPFQYDPAVAATNIFKRENPNVRSAFHVLNFEKFYKNTINEQDLKKAFLSINGVTDLINKIVAAMYTSANYDEYQVMKYMLARSIINCRLYPVTIPAVSNANMKTIAANMRAISNDFTFMSTKFNPAHVHNSCIKDRQYILLDTDFDAQMSVEVLASAFNMNEAEFLGHRVLIDGFGNLDTDRLSELFNNDPAYTALTDDEIAALKEIPAIVVDADWFMVYDNNFMMNSTYVQEGLYWNYWLHTWKMFSTSPFSNAAVFVPGTPSVTSVTVSPSTASIKPGACALFTAAVVTDNFAGKDVKWSVGEGATIDATGNVQVASTATAGDSITVTATSVYDSTKTSSAVITVA